MYAMKTIAVSTFSTRNNIFVEDDLQIGSLLYPDWFSMKAIVNLADGSSYLLEPKGIFSTGISVTQNDEQFFTTAANWKGQIIITDIINNKEYILKMKGIFSNSYILTDASGHELFCIRQIFSWKQFRSSYEIDLTDFDLFHRQNEILLFTAFYSYKNLVASVAAGTN